MQAEQDRVRGVSIKICGLTSLDDARYAAECGADFLGFVLFPGSPRAVTPAALRRIVELLDAGPKRVGVFVNMPPAQVEAVAGDCGLDVVQLHGDEPAAAFAGLSRPVWRAVRLEKEGPAPRPADWPAARYVLDAAPAGVYGGGGKPVDWRRAASFAARFAAMLAGGLTPANVAEAIARVRPLGVDVSSGVESEPGRKDRVKLKLFVENCRRAAADLPAGG